MKKIILILLLVPSLSHSIAMSTLRDDCRTLIKDAGPTNRARFSNSSLERFLNEGHKDLVQRAQVVRNSVKFELIPGVTYYIMPHDFLQPVRVTRDFLYLPQRSIQHLDKNQEWEEVKGLPINYFLHFSTRTHLGFYPFPDSSSSTGTIRADYIATAGELLTDTDEPFNRTQELQPHAYLISLYCAYRASIIDGMPQWAQFYRQEYLSGLAWFSEDGKDRVYYRPGAQAGGVGYR